MNRIVFRCLLLSAVLAHMALAGCARKPAEHADSGVRQRDGRHSGDWAGYGRTFDQQHFSPLDQISQSNVGQLGLAWSMDLPPGNSVTQPIAVDGVLYFAAGLSIVHAVNATTGKELWQYDPGVGEVGGLNLRVGWGVRGVAWWDDKVYVGTQDGRLLALDARSGRPVWTVQTFRAEDPAYISGAPRVFDGKVLIGFGSTTGAMRGYVSAYDAGSGKLLWRFYTVPGDPARGFENKAMEMAAKTWSGEWWKVGGGGMVWNSMAYDVESRTVYIGTGSPYPWNHRIRSEGKGDNLFVASIVAIGADTGEYKWHYQTVPGDTWDFDATMDIQLADMEIGGKLRKVLMQAPKNGFFYVMDRETGALISAEPYAAVTWATHVDLKTGRPVESPGARFRSGHPARSSPGSIGAHNWMPMAYSPHTRLVYIPAIDFEAQYSDIDGPWSPPTDRSFNGGAIIAGGPLFGMKPATGSLLAWSPATGKPVWRIDHPTFLNGGVLATGGELVFQGTIDGLFKAYTADTGKVSWQFDARAPILATPISYEADGKQYVTLLTGSGMGIAVYASSMVGPSVERFGIDPRTQARRVLTFAIDGKATLPPRREPPPPPDDPGFEPQPARLMSGLVAYSTHCTTCHGDLVVGIGNGPDLRRSAIPLDKKSFDQVVRSGVLEPRGMPRYPEFDDAKLEDIRQFIRARAKELRDGRSDPAAAPPLGSMRM